MPMFGDTLRQARAYKGVTLKEAEQATRINRHHLAALEDENFGALPPLIYQRGIVRNYATYLDLDPSKLLGMFEDAHGTSVDAEVVAAMRPLDMPNHWAPNFAIIAFMVVMSAIVFAWLYSAYFAEPEVAATAAPQIPTVTPIATQDLGMPTSPETLVSPTATTRPKPSPSPKPTKTPEATETPEATDTPEPPAETPPPDPAVQPAGVDSTQPQVPVEQPTPIPQGQPVTLSFSTINGAYLTVVVDGVTQHEQWLAAGTATWQMTGTSFQIYTDNLGDLYVSNPAISGEPFLMGGAGPGSFVLP